MKSKFLMVLLLMLPLPYLMAESKSERETMKHELRIGWGDQLFETLAWHNPTHIINTMPETFEAVYHENYHYNQHLWLEYQHRHNSWFSYGGMVDLSNVTWSDVRRNGKGAEVSRDNGHYFYNIVIMPTIYFTYFHHPYVNLHSGLGLGLGINGGSEQNIAGNRTDVGAAVNITVIGVSANYKRWFMSFDLGGMYSLKNKNTVFLASSRIMSVAVGVRF